jgi:hypothetical protein
MLTLTGTLLATSGCASTSSDRPWFDRVMHPFGQRVPEEGMVVSVSPPVEGPALGSPSTFVAPQPTRQNGSGLILDNNVPPLSAPPNGRLEPKAQPIPYVP